MVALLVFCTGFLFFGGYLVISSYVKAADKGEVSIGFVFGIIMMFLAGVLLILGAAKTLDVHQKLITETGHVVKISTTGKDEFKAWVKITYEDGKFEKVELINGTVVPFANAAGK